MSPRLVGCSDRKICQVKLKIFSLFIYGSYFLCDAFPVRKFISIRHNKRGFRKA
jgi:hypothetical protein